MVHVSVYNIYSVLVLVINLSKVLCLICRPIPDGNSTRSHVHQSSLASRGYSRWYNNRVRCGRASSTTWVCLLIVCPNKYR